MISRRQFLRMAGLTAVAAGTAGCSAIAPELDQRNLPDELTAVAPPRPQTIDTEMRFLNRAGYGPTPADLLHMREIGLAAYLEEQLHPAEIDDTAADLLARSLTLYQMDPTQLIEQEEKDGMVELIGSTVARARYSRRQLYEAMVEFWTDHFNIYVRKNRVMPLLKIMDDRDVIRPHALGRFRDLLGASAKSPAMLVYLDNVQNEAGHPNENYARELLELHTVGVDGGYSQQDVQELARALTGWTVGRRGRHTGKWVFDAEMHDDGAKQIMGLHLPAGQGAQDVEMVLDYLAQHPATATFIATKLVRRFVADVPPPALVQRVADTFLATDGDIRAMLRVLFLSDEFATAPPKLKRPFTFIISTLRALHVELRVGRARIMGDWLQQVGQLPFHWPPPNGYPDVSAAWATNLLPRWNFAVALLHDDLNGVSVPLEELATAGKVETPAAVLSLFASLLYGRSLPDATRRYYLSYVGDGPLGDGDVRQRLRDCIALMLAAPDFQWA